MNGGRVVLARTPDPDKVLPLMAAEGVTVTAAVPAVVQRWIDAVAAGATRPARAATAAGRRRPPAPEVARRAEPVLGGTLQQVFGMAEGLLNYTRPDDPEDIRIDTQGRPMCPDDEILVVDASDRPVPPDEMGALLTRGPYTPRGYYRAAEHNARAFTPDGWYRTGDVVRVHPSGNLVVEGRDKDMINRGGEKISAEEVENLVYRCPASPRRRCREARSGPRGAGVRGRGRRTGCRPDPRIGPRRPHRDAGGPLKLPEDLLVVDELPLTKVGKIDKKRLRDIVRSETDPVEAV